MKFKRSWSIALPCLLIALTAVYLVNPAGTNSKDPRARLIGYMPYRIPSDSMTPTLMRGDYILANTFSYHSSPPQRGDIVVFNFPFKPEWVFVKRVIGLPGDVIEMQGHRVKINGELQAEDYLQTQREFRATPQQYKEVVPEGQLLMLGDNRDNSADSRKRGFVPIKNVIGEVTRIWMSNDDARVGSLNRDEQPEPQAPQAAR